MWGNFCADITGRKFGSFNGLKFQLCECLHQRNCYSATLDVMNVTNVIKVINVFPMQNTAQLYIIYILYINCESYSGSKFLNDINDK